MDEEITRAEVKSRANHWMGKSWIEYSQSETHTRFGHAYRTDCSGFVSMALGVDTTPSPSTVNFPDYLHKISYDELKFGDVLGVLGPGTGGDNGHITLFASWLDEDHTQVSTWEHGGGDGEFAHPHAERHTLSEWTHPVDDGGTRSYEAWRYDHIVDAPPPPSKLGVAAVLEQDHRYHVFTVAVDGAASQRIFDGQWNPPEDMGGIVTGTPAALHPGDHAFELYGIGDDGLLRQHIYDDGLWLNWQRIAGGNVLGGISAVIAADGSRHLFAVSPNGQLYQRISRGSWSPWEPLGGTVQGTPAALYRHHGQDRFDVFVTDAQGHVVQQTYRNGAWHGWHGTVEGTVRPGVAACRDSGGAIHLFARGSDNTLRHAIYNGQWNPWESFAGELSCLPSAVSQDGRIDLFALDGQGKLTQKILLNHTWHDWQLI